MHYASRPILCPRHPAVLIAAAICPTSGSAHVLNIGFGMGLVDSALQARRPARHVIVEAHPDVATKMREEGWPARPGVEVVVGRWQDVWQVRYAVAIEVMLYYNNNV